MKMEMNETREMSSEKPSYTVAELQLLTFSFFFVRFCYCVSSIENYSRMRLSHREHGAICDDNFRENLLKCIFASEWNSFQFAVDFNAAACILCCSSICFLIRFSLESFYQICTIFIFNFHMCRQQRWRLRRRISSNKRDERARVASAAENPKIDNRFNHQMQSELTAKPPLMTWWFLPDFFLLSLIN